MTQTGATARKPPGTQDGGSSCFISAPLYTDLTIVLDILRDKSIAPVLLSSMNATALTRREQLARALSAVDLVIGVLDPKRPNENVYYELGYATALGKQVLLIAPSAMDPLPHDLDSVLRLSTTVENREAIAFALDQVLAAPKLLGTRFHPQPAEGVPIGLKAKHLLQEIDEAGELLSEQQLLNIIEIALRASGITVVVQSDAPGRGADLAVWSDALASSVGAPLLIELKRRIASSSQAHELMNQMAIYVQNANTQWALLLYLHAPPSVMEIDQDSVWPVLVLGVRELLTQLGSRSFVDIVRSLRNQRVHGVAG